jgi:transcriptional regulator GlxA family with amidase domain
MASSRSPRRRVVLIASPGVQLLDLTGPLEAFAGAAQHRPGAYHWVVASPGGGAITSSSGVVVTTRALGGVRPTARDTVLIAGGDEAGVRGAISDRRLRAWLVRAAPVVERLGSVCSGAFVLAATGLLDGQRAATHWSACDRLAAFRPALTVDRDAIYVRTGRLWTSAGVTTGIDMALAMIEDDLGREVADAAAARLVLYARRPGFQSQWSDALLAQARSGDPLAPGDSRGLARTCSASTCRAWPASSVWSVRTLHRRCQATVGTTPAKLIERLRVERARELLASGERAVKQVAAAAGFRRRPPSSRGPSGARSAPGRATTACCSADGCATWCRTGGRRRRPGRARCTPCRSGDRRSTRCRSGRRGGGRGRS